MIIKNRKSLTNVPTDMLPIGIVQSYIGLIAPSGYLLLNGQQVLKSRYPELYALCGNLFNNGQTPSTGMFYLPDMRGRVIAGLNSGDTEFDTIGKRYGSKTHILTINQLPSHTHIQNTHAHGEYTSNAGGKVPFTLATGGGVSMAGYWISAPNSFTGPQVMTTYEAAVNQNTGSGEEHNNIQPSITMNYIVKAEMITSVPASNIYDGLDSTSTAKALSANMGYELNQNINDTNSYLPQVLWSDNNGALISSLNGGDAAVIVSGLPSLANYLTTENNGKYEVDIYFGYGNDAPRKNSFLLLNERNGGLWIQMNRDLTGGNDYYWETVYVTATNTTSWSFATKAKKAISATNVITNVTYNSLRMFRVVVRKIA